MKLLQKYYGFFVLMIACSCGSTTKLSHEDFANELNSSESILQADLLVFHSDSSKSCLFIHIPNHTALFMRDSDMFVAKLKIYYELHLNYESKAIIDSGSKIISKSTLNSSDEINDSLLFPMTFGNNYVMKIIVKDINRNTYITRTIIVNKLNQFTRQNFILLNEKSEIQYRNYILLNEKFKLWSANDLKMGYNVRCYFRKFPIATPPFKIGPPQFFNYKADSIFSVFSDSISSLNLNRYGFYHFQSDTSGKDGFTVFQYCSDFPLITNSTELVEATRYLTTNAEFNDLMLAMDKKAAIDHFWINIGGNQEKARDLIRVYYSRVQVANEKFSSYMDGWKSDRGLIYIIFGPPTTRYKDDAAEYWNYTNQLYIPDLTFVFKKMANPFTDNDYSLIRQPTYDSPYYLAVEQWREGRIANDK